MEPDFTTSINSLVPKCQCVTFDSKGNVLGSCESLFSVKGLSGADFLRNFPFLEGVIAEMDQLSDDADPVFYPGLEFRYDQYRSICDFTFMKNTDARGNVQLIWLVYDNSIHYKMVIEKESPQELSFLNTIQPSTVSTFLKAG